MASTQSMERVTKASSNQLLSKFADLSSEPPLSKCRSSLQIIKAPASSFQRKRSKRVASGLGARELAMVTTTCCTRTGHVKRRMSGNLALLPGPPHMISSRRSPGTKALMRRMGMGKAENGTKALLAALETTWRKTVEGASKIFIEKHRSTHVRLISDIV